MSPPMISVIMPVRDGQTFLDECIQSIFAQTVRDFEFIVVDDGSKDRTAEILRRHAAQDPRLRIVTQAPAGIVDTAWDCAREGHAYLAALASGDRQGGKHGVARRPQNRLQPFQVLDEGLGIVAEGSFVPDRHMNFSRPLL